MNKESIRPGEPPGPAPLTREEAEGVADIAAEATTDSPPAQSLSETKTAGVVPGKLHPAPSVEKRKT